jgi:hypothetical protein
MVKTVISINFIEFKQVFMLNLQQILSFDVLAFTVPVIEDQLALLLSFVFNINK